MGWALVTSEKGPIVFKVKLFCLNSFQPDSIWSVACFIWTNAKIIPLLKCLYVSVMFIWLVGYIIFQNGFLWSFLILTTIMVMIFWDFLMFQQIFLSPQVNRSATISNKHGIYELEISYLVIILGNISKISKLHWTIA